MARGKTLVAQDLIWIDGSRLTASAALTDGGLGSVCSTIWWPTIVCNSGPGDPKPPSDP